MAIGLRGVAAKIAPHEKLKVLLEVQQLAVSSLTIFAKDQCVAADDITPVYVYIYAHAGLNNLLTTVK